MKYILFFLFTLFLPIKLFAQENTTKLNALTIHLPHRVTTAQSERLLKVAHGCTVHQSLAVPAGVAIELNPHPPAEKLS